MAQSNCSITDIPSRSNLSTSATMEKLATYALRRAMTFADRKMLTDIARQNKGNDYKLATLIESLVLSDLFMKR